MAAFQFLVGVLSLCLATGFPIDQYFVNPDASSLAGRPVSQFVYSYRPGALFQQHPHALSKPISHPELGIAPQYHNLVFNYVKDFAGSEPVQYVDPLPINFNNQATQFLPQQIGASVPNEVFSAGTTNNVGLNSKPTNEFTFSSTPSPSIIGDKPGLNKYFLPSDLLALPGNQNIMIRRNFDVLRTKTVKTQTRPTSLPPIGGVVSDYVLLRTQPNLQNLFPLSPRLENEENQQIKRELPEDDDSVVIEAEPFQNSKHNEEPAEHKQDDGGENEDAEDEDDTDDPHPGIAQSKPAAIALAGPGGVAQASPVSTALVGRGGLAVSAPSGTAVAGTRTQGAIPISLEKKEKDSKENKKPDTDAD